MPSNEAPLRDLTIITVDPQREVTIDHLPDGGIVLMVEDPKDVAGIQMGAEHVRQLRAALRPSAWPRALPEVPGE